MSVNRQEIADDYTNSLQDLTTNSKPLINMLTVQAEEKIEYATIIVQAIEKHLEIVEPPMKLPCLYLIDSILKHVGKSYITLFAQNIVSTFCNVFELVDQKTRSQMDKLRVTWDDVFPSSTIHDIDVRVKGIDPEWPIASPDAEETSTDNAQINSKIITDASASVMLGDVLWNGEMEWTELMVALCDKKSHKYYTESKVYGDANKSCLDSWCDNVRMHLIPPDDIVIDTIVNFYKGSKTVHILLEDHFVIELIKHGYLAYTCDKPSENLFLLGYDESSNMIHGTLPKKQLEFVRSMAKMTKVMEGRKMINPTQKKLHLMYKEDLPEEEDSPLDVMTCRCNRCSGDNGVDNNGVLWKGQMTWLDMEEVRATCCQVYPLNKQTPSVSLWPTDFQLKFVPGVVVGKTYMEFVEKCNFFIFVFTCVKGYDSVIKNMKKNNQAAVACWLNDDLDFQYILLMEHEDCKMIGLCPLDQEAFVKCVHKIKHQEDIT